MATIKIENLPIVNDLSEMQAKKIFGGYSFSYNASFSFNTLGEDGQLFNSMGEDGQLFNSMGEDGQLFNSFKLKK